MTAGSIQVTMRDRARRVAARLAELRPRTILLIGWLIFVLYAYPGYMSSDSVDQLLDARVGTFNDWHSPTMSEIWRWVSYVVAGPFGMLVLQSVLLLTGMYALIARVLTPRKAALVACALFVFPPVMATMAVIWRDSQMAGFLIAGLAAITSRRRAAQLAGLGLLVLACNMRPSAAFAVLPILLLGFSWRSEVTGWRRAAIALAVWAVVWLAASGLDAQLTSTETEHERVELATADVLGVLRYGASLDDAAVREKLAGVALRGDHLQARGAEFQKHPAKVSTGPDRLFDAPTDAEGRAALFAAQRRLALDQPRAYVTHRWHVTYRVLGLPRMAPKNLVFNGFTGSRWQGDQAVHTARHSAIQRGLIVCARMFAYTPISWPYIYVLPAIVLLVLAVRRRQTMPTILLASGLAYELTLAVVAVGPNAALSHWLVTATCLAGVLMLAYRKSSISASCNK